MAMCTGTNDFPLARNYSGKPLLRVLGVSRQEVDRAMVTGKAPGGYLTVMLVEHIDCISAIHLVAVSGKAC
jgi:hypothetical protein